MTTQLQLTRVLQQLFAAQARDVASRIQIGSDELPDMRHWIGASFNALKPILLQFWQQGIARTAANLGGVTVQSTGRDPNELRRYEVGNEAAFGKTVVPRKEVPLDYSSTGLPMRDLSATKSRSVDVASLIRNKSFTYKGWPHYRVKAKVKKKPDIEVSFDLFNPRVLDAVDQATLVLCRETLDTSTMKLQEALEGIKKLLREGLPQGAAVAYLAKKVREIFADPYRAHLIASSESSRAVHGGQLLAAKDSGVVTKKVWLSSSDSCDLCQSLDGLEKNLDEPFIVIGTGPYARVMYPPAHPACMCSMTEAID